jgi:hypothetical protein
MNGKATSVPAWVRLCLFAVLLLSAVFGLSACVDEDAGAEPTPRVTYDMETSETSACPPLCSHGTSDVRNWSFDTTTAGNGSRSVRSGTTGNSQSSCLYVQSGQSSRYVSFMYQVSSETGFDLLRLYVCTTGFCSTSTRVPSSTFGPSGSTGWNTFTYDVGATATWVYQWCYEKDGSIASNLDRAWIDRVQIY